MSIVWNSTSYYVRTCFKYNGLIWFFLNCSVYPITTPDLYEFSHFNLDLELCFLPCIAITSIYLTRNLIKWDVIFFTWCKVLLWRKNTNIYEWNNIFAKDPTQHVIDTEVSFLFKLPMKVFFCPWILKHW